VARAEDFRGRVGGSLAIISKRHPEPDQTGMLEMVGDVSGKAAIVVDDMISTGETVAQAAVLLRDRGASSIHVAATHGIFAGDAMRLLAESPVTDVVVSDTLPLAGDIDRERVKTITVAPLLAEAIMRIHKDLSISALFT